MAARVPAGAAELPASTPEAEGMSADKLAKVSEIMNRLVSERKIAGAIVLVARNGKLVFQETYGLRNLDGNLPVEHDTIFRIYSMSKAITSAAALMLVDEGQLDLNAPVAKYLPEFSEMEVVDGEKERPAKSPITVKDLFLHTSGITYGNAAGSATEKLFEVLEVIDMRSGLAVMSTKLSQIPLEFDPGTKWKYGASIDVLGYLVQKVSGQPLDVFLKERIFEPLGMTDTGFFVPPEKQARFAANYYSDGKGRLIIRDDPAKSTYLHKPGLASGGGGLVGTASDYMRFLLMIAGGGQWQGKRLLSPESVEKMRTNQLPKAVEWIGFADGPRTGVGFGLGFSVAVEPNDKSSNRKDEYGWGGAASTHYWVSPRDRLIVVTMEQRMPYSPETEEALKPVIYDAIVK
jgi:CubicO group peptidase (beta-lactamase class C family)